jgi:hypothetical protein
MALEGPWVAAIRFMEDGRKLLLYEIVPGVAGYRAGGDAFLSDEGLLLGGRRCTWFLVLQWLGHQ